MVKDVKNGRKLKKKIPAMKIVYNFLPFLDLLQFLNLNEHNNLRSGKVQKVVRKRSGFRVKALNFAIIAVQDPWSGTQNSVLVTLYIVAQLIIQSSNLIVIDHTK